METTAVDERVRFVRDFASGQWSMTELCERYGVTRPTGYKWVARYRAGGDDAADGPEPGAASLAASDGRRARDAGARGAAAVRLGRAGSCCRCCARGIRRAPWPARSTLNALLDRHGLLRKKRRRRRWTHPGAAPVQTDAPNQVWPADFKGQFKTRRRPVLLSADRDRSLQPRVAGVSRPAVGADRGHPAGVSRAVSRGAACPTRSAPTTARRSPRPASMASRR